ncbi:hypothetical protein OG777_21000 [Micromonospora peucetia]|uniref:Peptidase propeptide and YPEB domain-containing protein n=2 Tax=Micromonospora peucetia TaxID=47871 RepID=A0ABZ1E8E3_9ACTN|nr:hypothetical protein [Micromonospora peucetia]MCX4389388.1 hypothetical protein [Micromonospora peucetia]WSA29885.1 hypothetical protein OIE14_16750 [Micromonospora peucetia]
MDHDEARELATAEFISRMGAGKPRGRFRIDDWQISEPYEDEVWGLNGGQRCLIIDFVPQGEVEARGHFKLSMAVDPDTGVVDMLR